MSSKDDDPENREEPVVETSAENAEEPVVEIAAANPEELDLFTSTTSGPVYSIPKVKTEKLNNASDMTQQDQAEEVLSAAEYSSEPSLSMSVSEPPPKVDSAVFDETNDDSGDFRVSGHEDTLEPSQISAEPLSQPSESKPRSVHVNMDALHDEAMKSQAALAEKRAEFSPLESNTNLPRISFQNAAQNGLSSQGIVDGTEEVSDTGEFDYPKSTNGNSRRPFVRALMLLGFFIFAVLGYFAVQFDRAGFTFEKLPNPKEALSIVLHHYEKPVVAEAPPKPSEPMVKTVQGELSAELVQLDWHSNGRKLTLSGEVVNRSNVTHKDVELSVRVLDPKGKVLISRQMRCCQYDQPSSIDAGLNPASPNPLKSDEQIIEANQRRRFSFDFELRKPKVGEMRGDVSIHYSELVD